MKCGVNARHLESSPVVELRQVRSACLVTTSPISHARLGNSWIGPRCLGCSCARGARRVSRGTLWQCTATHTLQVYHTARVTTHLVKGSRETRLNVASTNVVQHARGPPHSPRGAPSLVRRTSAENTREAFRVLLRSLVCACSRDAFRGLNTYTHACDV